MTDHLADARACATSASRSPSVATAVFWLNATCEQIIAHLEAQNAPREAPQPERIDLMTDPKLHELLDQTKFGDQLILAHRIGKHATHISGPVLTDQTHDPSVGIDLLDGDPHIVRTPTGVVWAPVVQATLYRGGELIAKWDAADHLEAQTEASLRRGLADITAGRTVDLGSFAQPATDPPAAQQGDSGHGDGGEAARPNLNAQTAPSIPTDLTAPQSEPEQLGGSDFMDLADPEVRAGYLAAHEREVRKQIASELIPVVAHKGTNDTDLSLLDEAAHKLEHGYSFGSNVTAAVVRLIRNAIHIARQEQP